MSGTPSTPDNAVASRTDGGRTQPYGLLLIALAAFALVYVLPLDFRPLFSADETRYAEIPREMNASGDWVSPTLNGVRYFEKPPLAYWAGAISQQLFGENNFAARVPTTLAAGLTGAIVFFMAGAAGASVRTRLLAAAIYLSYVEVYMLGTFLVLDGLLALWLTAGIFAFYRAVSVSQASGATGNGTAKRWSALAGVAFGLAFLTKGFLGFAVPGIVLLPWLLWTGQLRIGIACTWPCVVAVLLTTLPWSIAMHLAEPDFWRYFFWEEHIRRFMGHDAQHKESAWFYVRLLPLLAFPWIFLMPAVIQGLRATRYTATQPATNQDEIVRDTKDERDFTRLLWLWCLIPFAFFSTSSGKLLPYIVPCFAPLAVLTAKGLRAALDSRRPKLFNTGHVVLGAMYIGILIGLWVAQGSSLAPSMYKPEEAITVVLFSAVLIWAAALALWAARSTGTNTKLAVSLVSVLPLLAMVPLLVPGTLLERKAPGLLLEPIAATVSDDTLVFSNSGIVRAAGWFLKRDDIFMISGRGELRYGLAFPEDADRFVTEGAFASMLKEYATKRDILLVCKRSCGDGYESALPPNATLIVVGLYRAWRIPKA